MKISVLHFHCGSVPGYRKPVRRAVYGTVIGRQRRLAARHISLQRLIGKVSAEPSTILLEHDTVGARNSCDQVLHCCRSFTAPRSGTQRANNFLIIIVSGFTEVRSMRFSIQWKVRHLPIDLPSRSFRTRASSEFRSVHRATSLANLAGLQHLTQSYVDDMRSSENHVVAACSQRGWQVFVNPTAHRSTPNADPATVRLGCGRARVGRRRRRLARLHC